MAVAVTVAAVAGIKNEPQLWGQVRVSIRDVTLTASGNNNTGAVTLAAAAVGLQRILGVISLGVSSGTAVEALGQIEVTHDGASALVVTIDGATALDLDDAETLVLRLAFLGY